MDESGGANNPAGRPPRPPQAPRPPVVPRLRGIACNVSKMYAYRPESKYYPTCWDIGTMGEPRENDEEESSGRPKGHDCAYCGALLFKTEALQLTRNSAIELGIPGGYRGKYCCCQGAVKLPPIQRSDYMEALWNEDEYQKLLLKYSRKINNQMALASTIVKPLTRGGGARSTQAAGGTDRPSASGDCGD